MAYTWNSVYVSVCLVVSMVTIGAMGFPLYGKSVIHLSCKVVKGTKFKVCLEQPDFRPDIGSNLISKRTHTGLRPPFGLLPALPKRNNMYTLVNFLSRRPSRRRIDNPAHDTDVADDEILRKLESFRKLMKTVKKAETNYAVQKRPFDSINFKTGFGGFK